MSDEKRTVTSLSQFPIWDELKGLKSLGESAWLAIQVLFAVALMMVVAGGMVLVAILAVASLAGQLKIQNGWLFIPLAVFLWTTFLIHVNKRQTF